MTSKCFNRSLCCFFGSANRAKSLGYNPLSGGLDYLCGLPYPGFVQPAPDLQPEVAVVVIYVKNQIFLIKIPCFFLAQLE